MAELALWHNNLIHSVLWKMANFNYKTVRPYLKRKLNYNLGANMPFTAKTNMAALHKSLVPLLGFLMADATDLQRRDR